MKAVRIVYRPEEVECEVKYYIDVDPCDDAHFVPTPHYKLDNKYFDTKEEAEEYKKQNLGKVWGFMTVKEKVCFQ